MKVASNGRVAVETLSNGPQPPPSVLVPGKVVHCQWYGRDNGFPIPNNISLSNALRFVVQPGSWSDAYRYMARTLYGFQDQRDNTGAGYVFGTEFAFPQMGGSNFNGAVRGSRRTHRRGRDDAGGRIVRRGR